MMCLYCRNPFLSRAGFDDKGDVIESTTFLKGRNPFLSRAGFDKFLVQMVGT